MSYLGRGGCEVVGEMATYGRSLSQFRYYVDIRSKGQRSTDVAFD